MTLLRDFFDELSRALPLKSALSGIGSLATAVVTTRWGWTTDASELVKFATLCIGFITALALSIPAILSARKAWKNRNV